MVDLVLENLHFLIYIHILYSFQNYILNYYIEINGFFEQSLDENLVSVKEWGNYYDMTIHDFETTIEPIIIKYDRSANEGGGIPEYVYNFTDVLKIEPQRLTEYYNIETGEKVVV